MKNRRISITSSIIDGIETMLNSNCSNDGDIEYVSNWVQNIKIYPTQKYSEQSLPNMLLTKLNLIKNQLNRNNMSGPIYHRS